LVALARKPFQRRPVETGEEIVAALLQLLHHFRVDLRHAVTNSVVQLDQGEEAPIAQRAEHEARDDTDGGLDLGLGESRQMQVVWERRRPKRFGSRTLFIRSMVVRSS
jgi:hypothetical protein